MVRAPSQGEALATWALCVVVAIAQRRRLSPDSAGLLVLSAGFLAYLLSRADEFHATPLIITLGTSSACVKRGRLTKTASEDPGQFIALLA